MLLLQHVFKPYFRLYDLDVNVNNPAPPMHARIWVFAGGSSADKLRVIFIR
jgi:hypothetical protein